MSAWREGAVSFALALLVIAGVGLGRARAGLAGEAAVRVLVADEAAGVALASELRGRRGTAAAVVDPADAARRISRWVGVDLAASSPEIPWVVRATPPPGEPFAEFVARVRSAAGGARVVVPEAHDVLAAGARAAGALAWVAWLGAIALALALPAPGSGAPLAPAAGLAAAVGASGLGARALSSVLDLPAWPALAGPWGFALLAVLLATGWRRFRPAALSPLAALLLLGALPAELEETYDAIDAERASVAAAERGASAAADAVDRASRDLAEAEDEVRRLSALALEAAVQRESAEAAMEIARRRLGEVLDDLVSSAHPRWLSLLIGGSPSGPSRDQVRDAQTEVTDLARWLERLDEDAESLAARSATAAEDRDAAAAALHAAEADARRAGDKVARRREESADALRTLRRRRDALEREADPEEVLDRRGPRWEVPVAWPLDEIRLTSKWGMRVHPISGVYRMHHGQDFGGPTGTPVYSVEWGRVVFVGTNGGYGKMVIVEHAAGKTTRYAHLSRILVDNGQAVRRGDRIGLVGSTGASTGPHLHFEVRTHGESEDPRNVLP